MHMISKKDLNSAEMDTFTKSCSPTIVLTAKWWSANAWKRPQCTSKNWIYSWPWKSSRKRQQSYRSESFAMKTDILTNGSTVKNHISINGIRIQCNTENFVPIVVPGLSASSTSRSHSSTSMTPSRQEIDHPTSSSSSSTSLTTTVSSDSETRAREDLSGIDSQPASVPSSHVERIERGDPLCSDIPEWLQEFRENLLDDGVPERRDSHASSHEPSLERTPARSVDLGKHSVYNHFPKDRNCEICQRTKITRAPCRRRIGGAVPRTEIFGDLITADHKVVRSESCESRSNLPYAVVVQDLATQWIQSHRCKTKTSQETQRSLQKFLERDRNLEVIYTWDCAQSKRRHLCRVAAIRSGWKLVGIFLGMLYLSAKRSRSLVWWENSIREAFWKTI